MGNHSIDCDYCGKDTRGLSGVRGCNSQVEAQDCWEYNAMLERQGLKSEGSPRRDHVSSAVGSEPTPLWPTADQYDELVEVALQLALLVGNALHMSGIRPGDEVIASWCESVEKTAARHRKARS